MNNDNSTVKNAVTRGREKLGGLGYLIKSKYAERILTLKRKREHMCHAGNSFAFFMLFFFSNFFLQYTIMNVKRNIDRGLCVCMGYFTFFNTGLSNVR